MAKNKLLVLTILVSLLTGCAGTSASKTQLALNGDGYISINRVAPKISAPTSLLGFVPVAQEKKERWIAVDTSVGTVSLMEGSSVLSVTHSEGKIKMKPGSYALMHKQRSPLWYAGDTYFQNRNIPVPAPGDKERYRRGALGDFALFIDRDTSLHSSPVWTEEVGGLRISDLDIRKIYYSLDIGSKIEIK